MYRYPLALLISLSALVVGCANEVDDSPVEVRTGEASLTESPAESSDDEAAAKRAWNQRHEPVVQPVDWVEVDSEPKLDLARLPESERAKFEGLDVPALLPDVDFVSDAFVVTGPHWYSARMNGPGHSLYIQGNRAAFGHDMGLTDEQKKAVKNFTVYRTHAIPTLAFNRFGVAYTIDVECARPLEDSRCTEDEYVLSIAEGLVLAGGAR